MASSGSFLTSGWTADSGDVVRLKFEWEISSQSVANNTTTIAWKLVGVRSKSAYVKAGGFKVVIDGDTVYSKSTDYRIQLYNGTVVASGTKVIAHNADGSRSFTASAEGGIYTYAVNCTGSGTFTIDQIPRASQPSLVTYPNTTNDVGDFGETFSIHMNRHSSAFTHTVRYEYGNRSGTIATGVTNGTTWAVPLEFMNDIPNATFGSGRIYVDTYNDSTKIGTKYTGFTVTVPESVKPTASFKLEDITGVDDIYGSPVKGLSKIKITVSCTPAYSSPIVGYYIRANGESWNGESEVTTGVLKNAGTSGVYANAVDHRGRNVSFSYDMTVQDYTAPKVTALAVRRCNADGSTNDRGEYVKVTFSAEVSSMNSKNTAAYTLKYKKSADSAYTSVSLTALKNKYAVSDHTYIFAADGSSSYDVDVTVADRHGTASRSTSASTAFTLINYHPEGNALRFGGVAEEENTFQNDLEFRQVGNHYSFQPEAFGGTKGYILLAVITLNTLNVNAPIVFQINRRGGLCPMNVYVRFASSSTTTDPDLASITYEGDNFGAFMVKAAESTWKLYVDNITGWSNPCLQDWFTTDNQMARLSVEFPSEIVEGTDPSVLGTYYRATPAKMPSILDYVYPVGSIYLSYSHVSPATMFGGTWVRIENAFLWAVDANGTIGQTGGEKTHTLTISEIPPHMHQVAVGGGSTEYGQTRTAITGWAKATSGYIDTSTVLNTGSGGAHNNMPPYIQVSAWRRTA